MLVHIFLTQVKAIDIIIKIVNIVLHVFPVICVPHKSVYAETAIGTIDIIEETNQFRKKS